MTKNELGRLAASRHALGQIARFEAYDPFGNVTRTVDPNGFVTERVTEDLGRCVRCACEPGRGPLIGCNTCADCGQMTGAATMNLEGHVFVRRFRGDRY